MEDKSLIRHNSKVLDQLSAGDLVQFPRGAYSHWAVYIGGEEIVHLAGEDNDGLDAETKPQHVFTICGVKFDKAKVCKDNFWDVVGVSKACKNNDNDKKLKPLKPEKIVQNALSKIGKIGYNLFTSNCEHFAKWCRYEVEKSDQVDNVVTGVAVGFAATLLIGAVYGLAKYFKDDEVEEEESHMNSKRKK